MKARYCFNAYSEKVNTRRFLQIVLWLPMCVMQQKNKVHIFALYKNTTWK